MNWGLVLWAAALVGLLLGAVGVIIGGLLLLLLATGIVGFGIGGVGVVIVFGSVLVLYKTVQWFVDAA